MKVLWGAASHRSLLIRKNKKPCCRETCRKPHKLIKISIIINGTNWLQLDVVGKTHYLWSAPAKNVSSVFNHEEQSKLLELENLNWKMLYKRTGLKYWEMSVSWEKG